MPNGSGRVSLLVPDPKGLQDTDEHWQFFVGMMHALHPRCQIHGAEDFFIVGFEMV